MKNRTLSVKHRNISKADRNSYGSCTVQEALDQLLMGTSLSARLTATNNALLDKGRQNSYTARVEHDVNRNLTLRNQTRYNKTHRDAVISTIRTSPPTTRQRINPGHPRSAMLTSNVKF